MKKKTLGIIAAVGVSALAATAIAADGKGGKRFDRLDSNGDGEISQPELDAHAAARDERREARRAEMMENADTDNSGSVSRDEMDTYRAAKRAERRGDTNGDGVVSRAEFEAKSKERFDRMDKNGDGVLSEDEQRSRRGHRRGHKRGR